MLTRVYLFGAHIQEAQKITHHLKTKKKNENKFVFKSCLIKYLKRKNRTGEPFMRTHNHNIVIGIFDLLGARIYKHCKNIFFHLLLRFPAVIEFYIP